MRFKEFHNEYTILPLGQRLKIKSGKSQKNIECNNGKYKIYGTGGIIGFTNKYLYDKESVGIGRKGTIDKPFYFNEPFWTVDTLFYSEIKENNVAKYIYYLFQTIPWKKYNTSTGVPSLTSSSIEAIEKGFPLKEEQYKIATFLSFIDKRIQTQIKIIEDYKMLKKEIIERIFLTTDTSWTKCSFKDIFKERKELHINDGTVVHATLSKEGIYPKTDRYDRDFLVKDENKKYKVSYLNDICYNPANLKFGVITRNSYGKCIISPIYVTYTVKPGFNPKFIELFVTRSAFLKEIRRYEQGTVYERMAVSSDDFLTYETRLPNVEVQNDIVNNIDILDKKITQELEYLELLAMQKDYLLSNMFI